MITSPLLDDAKSMSRTGQCAEINRQTPKYEDDDNPKTTIFLRICQEKCKNMEICNCSYTTYERQLTSESLPVDKVLVAIVINID